MRAALCHRYGPPNVLRIADVPRPVCKPNQILIRVHASTATQGDVRVRGFDVPPGQWLPFRLVIGLRGPRQPILGSDVAGKVVEVGSSVTRWKVGDRVFGQVPLPRFGAHAEYVCMAEDWPLAPMPQGATFAEAAAVPFMGLSALYFLTKAGVEAGQQVLIYGASGSVGSFAVQLAAAAGAQVTGVCGARNLALIQNLGAQQVLDYRKQDYAQAGGQYDVIFDAVGKTNFAHAREALRPGGAYVTVAAGVTESLQQAWTSFAGGHRVIGGTAVPDSQGLEFLKAAIEEGKLRAVIDRTYPLEEIAEAHRYVEGGHKTGSVVIVLDEDSGNR